MINGVRMWFIGTNNTVMVDNGNGLEVLLSNSKVSLTKFIGVI